MVTIIEIADAVTATLNVTGFSLPFTAKRLYQPLFELPEMQQLRVSVVPAAIPAMDKPARTLRQRDYRIDVAVQKKYSEQTPAELDPLMSLVEEIIDRFEGKRLETYPRAICVKAENEPVFSQEHIEQFRQFTSVIALTFRTVTE